MDVFDAVREKKTLGHDDNLIRTELQKEYTTDRIDNALNELKHMKTGGEPNLYVDPIKNIKPQSVKNSSDSIVSAILKTIVGIIVFYLVLAMGITTSEGGSGYGLMLVILLSPFIVIFVLIIKHLNR